MCCNDDPYVALLARVKRDEELNKECWAYLGRSWADVQRSWDPASHRQEKRYNVRMDRNIAHKVIASVVIVVVAAFLASTVHPVLALIALLAILLWV